jgi:hypothetical protein
MVVSCPDSFTPWEKGPQYPLDRRLVGHTTGLNNVQRRKILPVSGLEL